MSPSVQAIRRFLEAHDRFAAHNGITVEDADYDYGKVSLAVEDHAKTAARCSPSRTWPSASLPISGRKTAP